MPNELLSSVMSPEVQGQILSAEGQRTSMGIFGFRPSSLSTAKRLNTLENKTVYLVDTGFGGS